VPALNPTREPQVGPDSKPHAEQEQQPTSESRTRRFIIFLSHVIAATRCRPAAVHPVGNVPRRIHVMGHNHLCAALLLFQLQHEPEYPVANCRVQPGRRLVVEYVARSVATARAMATSRAMPPESTRGRSPALHSIPTSSSATCTRRPTSSRFSRNPLRAALHVLGHRHRVEQRPRWNT